MHRIDTSNAVANLFGPGKSGFGPGDPATNSPATFVDKDFFNAIQEELANLVEGAGLTLDKANRAQVLAALQSMFKPSIPGERRAFYRNSPPPGRWLRANGAAVSVASYADLTSAIYCGDANNASADWGFRCTNNSNPGGSRATNGAFIVLPDERGRFSRGWADNGGIDSGRSLWSYQDQAVQPHAHSFVAGVLSLVGGVGFGGGGLYGNSVGTSSATQFWENGPETRPVNTPALVCIAY